jgi:hypothetical protein
MPRFFAVVRKRSKSDHVFLNGRGKPWTMNAVRLRVMRLKDKLGLADDVCAYLISGTPSAPTPSSTAWTWSRCPS